MIRENNIKNRAISVFLVISMLVTSLFNSLIAMAYSETIEYEKNIGCIATFNTDVYDYFPVSDDPSNLSWDTEYQLIEEDLEEGFKVVITDYHISNNEGDLPCLWYKVEAAPDCEAPEKLIEYPWVFQNYLGEDADAYDSLIIEITEKDNITVIDEEGNEVGEQIELPQYEKKKLIGESSLSGDVDYQWQIFIDETWIDIYGADEPEFLLSYGVVATVLDEFQAKIRLTTRKSSKVIEGDPIEVTVIPYEEDKLDEDETQENGSPTDYEIHSDDEDVTELTIENDSLDGDNNPIENGANAEYSIMKLSTFSNADEVNGVMLADENGDSGSELETYTVIINYVYQNGEIAAPSWSGTFPKGSEVKETIQNPMVKGFAPKEDSCTIDISSITQDEIYTVTYYPAEVEFKVYHYKQNAENDYYILDETETMQGYTGSTVGENLKKEYKGFYAYNYDTTLEIAADGSTEVEIYYDRYYYLMSFDLGGGYGVEPIYARYGTPISVGTPNRPGYSFTGWDGPIPDTMPAENKRFTAQWTVGDTSFDVVFWYENADDDGYSQAGVLENVPAESGTIVNGVEYKERDFSERDDEHFTYSHADENVTVQGDGSTVVNVYYTRNKYNLIFEADGLCVLEEHSHDNCKIVCTLPEHQHSCDECCNARRHNHSAYSPANTNKCTYGYEHTHSTVCYDCEKIEHTHNNSCKNASSKSIVKVVNRKYESKISHYFPIVSENGTSYSGYSWTDKDGDTYGYALQTLDVMPGNDVTFTGENRGTKCVIYYYVEIVNGEELSGLTTRTFNGKTYKLMKSVEHNFNYITYEEEYHNIDGFSRSRSNADPAFGTYQNNQDSAKLGGSGNGYDHVNYLYYDRVSYNLTFSNHGTTVSDAGGRVQYEAPLKSYNFNPDYPVNFEPDAYVFEGWYESPFFGDTKVDFETVKMPANDLTLYAKWTPKTHTVKIFKTNDLNKQIGETQTVSHGSLAEKPETPTNGSYSFVGWFYEGSDGKERAFDFSMPVNQDLVLYGKWSSNVLVNYTIKYAVEEGEKLIYIAPSTTGQALAGTTKTFLAKAGDDLNEEYREGYFPETSSHSITLSADDASKNIFTFVYVAKDKVNYTVRYIDKATGEQLEFDKNSVTTKAIVTETFEIISGYMPDAYQKTLVLSANEQENIITFYYIKDTEHAPVQVIHYIQNIEGEGYTVYQNTSSLNTAINGEFSASILLIDGFNFIRATANDKDVTPETGNSTVSGTVTAEGLVLKLYYNRNLYPYEFRFVEEGTDKVLAEPERDIARYGAQVVKNAKQINGYTSSRDSGSINIKIEKGDKAELNVYTFYYKRALADLTITKSGADDIDENQSFIFKVTGIDANNTNISITVVIHGNDSVTIKDLPVGKYQVKEISDWSWRYSPKDPIKEVSVDADGTAIPFENERTKIFWLDGNAYCDNRFGKGNASSKADTSGEEEVETNE